MMIRRFSEKSLKLLKATAKYKFIGYSQFKRLGIEAHSSNLSSMVRDLTKCAKPFLKEVPHRPQYEKKFYLTKRGAELLVEMELMKADEIKYPKHTVNTSSQEQKHRSQTVDFQIELDLACEKKGINVVLCDRYFDTTGNTRERNLKSKTALIYEDDKTLKADILFIIELPNGTKEAYTFEHENGNDSLKSFDKMIQHGKAILLGSLNKEYSFNKGYRTLWVFEHESMIEVILNKVEGNPFFKNMKEHFLMKPYDLIADNFFGDWRNLDGDIRRLF